MECLSQSYRLTILLVVYPRLKQLLSIILRTPEGRKKGENELNTSLMMSLSSGSYKGAVELANTFGIPPDFLRIFIIYVLNSYFIAIIFIFDPFILIIVSLCLNQETRIQTFALVLLVSGVSIPIVLRLQIEVDKIK